MQYHLVQCRNVERILTDFSILLENASDGFKVKEVNCEQWYSMHPVSLVFMKLELQVGKFLRGTKALEKHPKKVKNQFFVIFKRSFFTYTPFLKPKNIFSGLKYSTEQG